MSDYDFKTLNDKEFEILCTDLLGKSENHRFERFKAGKDLGVDGRFFKSDGEEVILQCKHWANTPLKQLISTLKKNEKPKLDKLKPKRYLLAVSNSLSRLDKKNISNSLAPYIISESDIYGKEDLNDLLRRDNKIEQRHYKLWLHSSAVLGHIYNNAILGRSAFSLDEIIRESAKYVVTANHQFALKKLEHLGVVIITGDPGVGKTTLADHLCLHYVAQNYAYLKIAEDVREAESVFDPDTKQVVYFDDFLGRNYLEALKGHEGSQITQFIRRVASNKNKRFVLTSRSTILNQGKLLIDSLEHQNVQRNEIELRIQGLTDLDKAQILYNHIWHSGLDNQYIEQLYIERRYRKVIKHKNFNPRLISYIVDVTRLDDCPPQAYWNYINQSLSNPSQIWENPFIAQQDDFGRAIIFLVALHGSSLGENILAGAYRRFIALDENKNFRGRQEFQSNMRLLTGSFLNRTVELDGKIRIDLFNPSIADYILQRYSRDTTSLRLGFQSLQTTRSTITLRSLYADHHLKKADALAICESLIQASSAVNFSGSDVPYISALCDFYIQFPLSDLTISAGLGEAIRYILKGGFGQSTDDSFRTIQLGLSVEVVTDQEALDFVATNSNTLEGASEIKALTSLLSLIPKITHGYQQVALDLKTQVIEILSDSFSDFIDTNSAFSEVDYGDHKSAERKLEQLIEKEFSDLGIEFEAEDIVTVLGAYDVIDGLHSYFENSYDGDDRDSIGPTGLAIDEIDDLFERS